MAKGYLFDQKSVQRIADAVRKIERQLMDLTGKIRGRPATLITYPVHPAAAAHTVGTTAETEAAQTDNWDIYTEDEEDLEYTRLTRMAYASAGGQILYGYYRTETYDRFGRLTKVSGETRVTIDTPEACTT